MSGSVEGTVFMCITALPVSFNQYWPKLRLNFGRRFICGGFLPPPHNEFIKWFSLHVDPLTLGGVTDKVH